MFLGQGGHVREDLPAIVAMVAARHPAVAVTLATAVGEHDAVLDRIAEVAISGMAG